MRLGLWQSQDEEKRKLRTEVATLRHARESQLQARQRLEEEIKGLKQVAKVSAKRIKELEKRCQELKQQRDSYRAMIFKPNVKPKENVEANETDHELLLSPKKRKRGRIKGHVGKGRANPAQVDEVRRVYLEKCPDCGEPLARSNSHEDHTVEDIPPIEQTRSKVTLYEKELQWCGKCRKTVKAVIEEVVPRSRLGINVLLYVFVHKYIARSAWATIVWSLEQWYGIKVSQGALVQMVQRAQSWLEPKYAQILDQIRASPVKHADETGWRVDGANHWLWGFFTSQQAYYAIEESRGKGIPAKILNGSHPDDVLVRDDYAAYRKLPLKQQSCWTHLLRNSREAAQQPKASKETRKLHEELKQMFVDLNAVISQPFDLVKRQASHDDFRQKIQLIISADYHDQDAKKIQTRIANQNDNLLTALLHDNVPLTNNLAERGIRPMVVIRKISGGSRSWKGAKTHAVNMSVLQSIRLRQQPLIPTLKSCFLTSQN